ncbi:MAG: 50S ribosomal protein L25, partial [Nocardioides sp.]|nr:50S ribosomal protein L25 [Nocardioides sp.]
THIPEYVEVDIEGAAVGTQIHASDLKLPKGTTLAADADLLLVNITAASTAEEVEAELSEAEAEAGIERDEPEEDAAESASENGDAEE